MSSYQPNPTPGPQNPGKYPVATGPHYARYGELQGYVYNPYTDKYSPDPVAAKKLAQDQGLMAPDPKTPSLASSILPVAATVGSIYGAQALAPELVKGGKQVLGGLYGAGKDAITGATTATAPTVATTAGSGAVNGLVGAGTDSVQEGINAAANPAGYAETALPGTSETVASGAANSGAQGGLFSAGGAGSTALGAAGTALGTYEAIQGIKNQNPIQAGLGGAGAVMGLNALGYTLGPWGVAATIAAPAVLSVVSKLFDHETTRERAKKNTNELMGMSSDPSWQNYVGGIRQQYDSAPTGKAFDSGKYSTWDEYKQAGLDAGDLMGVYGNLKTFGPDWIKYSPEQQKAITQALINNDLYASKKGDVVVTDEAKAKEIANQALAATPAQGVIGGTPWKPGMPTHSRK